MGEGQPPVAARHEQPRLGGVVARVGRRLRPEDLDRLAGAQRAPGRGGQGDQVAPDAREPGQGAPHRAAQPLLGREPGGRRARRLAGDQRVALGRAGHPGGALAAQTRGRVGDDGRDRLGAERPQGHLGQRAVPPAHRLERPLDLAVGRRAAGDHDQRPQVAQPAAHVPQQRQARRVGAVQVLQQDDGGRPLRRPGDRLDDRVEDPQPLEVGGRRGGGLAPPRRLDRRAEQGEVGRPAGLGGRRGGGADQAAQRLRPRREGGPALEVERRAGRGPRARLGGLVHDLGREPALADAGDPCDGRDAAAAAHGGLERGAQDGQLGLPPAQGGPGRRGRRRGGRRGRGGRRRGRGRAAGAQPVGELAGLGRGGDPELGGQHVPAAAVGGHGLGALAGRGQAADEGAVAGLAQPVVTERPARPFDRRRCVPVGLGELGQPVERRDEAVAPGVLRLDRPLVGDLGEERARRELDRPLQRGAVAGREQPLGLLGVDPPRQVRRQARARAVGDQVVAPADGLERRPHAPQCAAQGGARAGVQDVGPEDPGQAGARHRLGAAEEVGQERPRLHAGDVRDRTPVDLDGQPPEEPSAQHPRHLGPLPTGGQSPRNEPGARDRRGDRGPTEVECVPVPLNSS